MNSKKIFSTLYLSVSILVILLFLLYNMVIAFWSLEGTPQKLADNPPFPYFTEKPLTEDGYYMLTVAWNIAKGKGFTYNYGIRTTGVQPLAAIVYSVPALLVQSFGGDKYDFARSIIILSALLQVVFAYLVYRLALSISRVADKHLYFLISVCVVLLNFKVLLNFANGLETGLYLVLLSVFFLYWIRYESVLRNSNNIIGLGLLSGLLLLCRLDSAVILLVFFLLLLIYRKIKVSQLVLVSFAAILCYLPWQLYVWDVTGNLLQSSARSQTGLFPFFDLPNKLELYFASGIQHLTPFLFTGNVLIWLMFPLGIAYLLLLFIGYKKYWRLVISDSATKTIKIISITFSALLIIYFFFSSAPHFYFRYTSYLMVLSLPVIVVLFAYLLRKFSRVRLSFILILIIIVFGAQAFLYLHSGKSSRAFTVRAEFVGNNFKENDRIAAFQTGILGYFYENVFNLDGKIDNSALVSFSHGVIEHYIDSMRINVLMEWKDFVPILFKKEYLEKYWLVYSDDIGDGRTICYVRKQ